MKILVTLGPLIKPNILLLNALMFLLFLAGLYEELRRIEPDFAFTPRDTDVADQGRKFNRHFRDVPKPVPNHAWSVQTCVNL